jgi:hypothetical protein
MKRTLLFTLLLLVAVGLVTVRGQTETLTNSNIIEMTQVGLGKDLIVQKLNLQILILMFPSQV